MLSNLCFHILLLYLWCFPFCNDITCFLPYVCNLCLNIFTGHRFWGWQFFFFSALETLYAASFQSTWLLMRNPLSFKFFFSVYLWCPVSLAAMKFHSLSYMFRCLTIMWIYLDLSCLRFAYLFGSIGLFMSFVKFRNLFPCPCLLLWFLRLHFLVYMNRVFYLFPPFCCWAHSFFFLTQF